MKYCITKTWQLLLLLVVEPVMAVLHWLLLMAAARLQ